MGRLGAPRVRRQRNQLAGRSHVRRRRVPTRPEPAPAGCRVRTGLGPCVLGICALDPEMRCAADPECREKQPCLLPSDSGSVRRIRPRHACATRNALKRRRASSRGEGVCSLDEKRPCSRDEYCAAFGPCRFGGTDPDGHRHQDLSRPFRGRALLCLRSLRSTAAAATARSTTISSASSMSTVRARTLLARRLRKGPFAGCANNQDCKLVLQFGINDVGPCTRNVNGAGVCALAPERKCLLEWHCQPGNVGPCLPAAKAAAGRPPAGGAKTESGSVACACRCRSTPAGQASTRARSASRWGWPSTCGASRAIPSPRTLWGARINPAGNVASAATTPMRATAPLD